MDNQITCQKCKNDGLYDIKHICHNCKEIIKVKVNTAINLLEKGENLPLQETLMALLQCLNKNQVDTL